MYFFGSFFPIGFVVSFLNEGYKRTKQLIKFHLDFLRARRKQKKLEKLTKT